MRRFVKNQSAWGLARVGFFAGGEFFEKSAARAGFFRQESEKVEVFGGKSRSINLRALTAYLLFPSWDSLLKTLSLSGRPAASFITLLQNENC